LQLSFKTPETKDFDKDRQTKDLYLERIRDEKETIFTALKKLATTLTSDVFTLPGVKYNDEVAYKTQTIT